MKTFNSKKTEEKFRIWLNVHPESWHPLDYERFHDFVLEMLQNKDFVTDVEISEAISELKEWQSEEYKAEFIEKVQIKIDELELFFAFLKDKGLINAT